MTQARDEAAKEWYSEAYDIALKDVEGWEDELEAFKFGAKWAIAHDPVVVGLIDTLESISKNSCCDQCQEAKKWAVKALAAYEKEVGSE